MEHTNFVRLLAAGALICHAAPTLASEPADADDETIQRAALASPVVARQLDGREPKRVIVVPGRLVNIVC